LQEVEHAFNTLFGQPKYGGGANEAVLIQEFADGPEYAVDTVAMNGDIKIVALWKYHKLSKNGAPFVYQCSELIPVCSKEEHDVCDYCISVLKAQDLKWGPTHTEIRSTSKGPRLIEINARWHAQNFIPIVRRALGYDAVTATLDAFFEPGIKISNRMRYLFCYFIQKYMVDVYIIFGV
jgi:biotin carboxylase